MTAYQLAKAFTLKAEGGFTVDDGGATMEGCTQAVYDAYRTKHGLPLQSVELIGSAELDQIMIQEYWTPVHCGDLPVDLAIAMFDWNYNTYPGHATKDLQFCLGVKMDGEYGPKTAQAIHHTLNIEQPNAPYGLLPRFLDRRREWYKNAASENPAKYAQYLDGWLKRVDQLETYIKENAT